MIQGESTSPLKYEGWAGSTLQGAGSGAASGAMIGGAPGAVIGGIVGGVAGFFGGKKESEAQDAADEAYSEYMTALDDFMAAPVENPYSGLYSTLSSDTATSKIGTENFAEDLQVNKLATEFLVQQQQGALSDQLKAFTAGAGSGGGVAGIANLLAKQNAQVRQQISADIGKQEAANQRLAVQGAERARGVEMQSALAQDKMRVQSALQRERIQMAQAKGEAEKMDIERDKEMAYLQSLGFGYQGAADSATAIGQSNQDMYMSMLQFGSDYMMNT